MLRSVSLLMLLLTFAAFSATLHVPSQYPTIQAGINTAVEGDTVLVADGIYTGAGNKNLDYLGKAIVVISENGLESCVIDCEFTGGGFNFHSGENLTSILSGFKIINGYAENGGGIYCDHSSPTITFCQLSGNKADDCGGGIYNHFSDPLIEYCTLSDDSAGWDGGGIYCYESRMTLRYCEIIGNRAFFAGGIWCEYSDPIIEHCTFQQNVTPWDGGGILVGFYSNAIISDCVFAENSAWRGGGIWCHKSDLIMADCLIENNSADCGGGIMCYWQAEVTINHCTVTSNSAETDGGGIHCSYSSTEIVNTIVAGNRGNGGIYFDEYAETEITYGDFCHNEGGNFSGNVPAGLGEIVGLNVNGDSCDCYFNLFADPLFADPGSGNYQLTWANFPIPDSTMSPCIDAGDPDSPRDPDSTVADIGASYFDQGPVIIALLSENFPIIIPVPGGSFSYSLEGINRTSAPVTMDVWCAVTLPNGQGYGPVLGPFLVTIPANTTISRLRTQFVPARAPAGQYFYQGYIGDYPDSVWYQDSFPFSKLGIVDESLGTDQWTNAGEAFDLTLPVGFATKVAPSGKASDLPANFFVSFSPNPFNPTTVARYQIPDARYVSLKVYDISGRLVATLIDGWREAGEHRVTFNGLGLPSGIYFAKLTAGPQVAVEKMVLIK